MPDEELTYSGFSLPEMQAIVDTWRTISDLQRTSDQENDYTSVNESLRELAADPEHPLAKQAAFWLAENLATVGDHEGARERLRWVHEHASDRFVGQRSWGSVALEHIAELELRQHGPAGARDHYRQLLAEFPEDPDTFHHLMRLGWLEEEVGNREGAISAYEQARELGVHDDSLVRLRIATVESGAPWARAELSELVSELRAALDNRDIEALRALATGEVIFVAPGAGCMSGQPAELVLDRLTADLARTDRLEIAEEAERSEGHLKAYLQTQGWQGEDFRGLLHFQLRRGPEGWVWGGLVGEIVPTGTIGLTIRPRADEADARHEGEPVAPVPREFPSEFPSELRERDVGVLAPSPTLGFALEPHAEPLIVSPAEAADMSNDAIGTSTSALTATTLKIKAPWESGTCFRAGGVTESAVTLAASIFTPWPFNLIPIAVAAARAQSHCGYGLMGFYYGQSGHNTDRGDHFAVDFTRFTRGVPWALAVRGHRVLAVAEGIVSRVVDKFPNGSSGDHEANLVKVDHWDADEGEGGGALVLALFAEIFGDRGAVARVRDQVKFRSDYLHMEGGPSNPRRPRVKVGLYVPRGAVLGFMDDTGISAFDHLHFSFHDRATGKSLKLSALDGQSLGDNDAGKCVSSSNVAK